MTHPAPTEVEATHGAFFGSALDANACEILAIANIDRKLLADEARLYQYKWFDYRPLHPTLATYLMAHHYNRAYGAFMGECFDHSKRFMAAFKGRDVMAAREKKSFWKLRQRIDELGIRYDFFVREAMKWCGDMGWKQPPRPAHLATNDDLMVHVANQWEIEQRAKIQWAHDPRYTAAEFIGAPDQLAYEEHICTRIMQRPLPKYSIHAALYIYDALRIETALARLPAQAVSDAIEHCRAIVSHD